jgi:hypothetical protein
MIPMLLKIATALQQKAALAQGGFFTFATLSFNSLTRAIIHAPAARSL